MGITISLCTDTPEEMAAVFEIFAAPPHIELDMGELAHAITSSATRGTCEESASSSFDSKQRGTSGEKQAGPW